MGFQVTEIVNEKLNVELNKSKVEKVIFSPENPIPSMVGASGSSYTADFHVPRDTKVKYAGVPHALMGIFEQSINIYSDLDVSFTVSIRGRTDIGGGEYRNTNELIKFDMNPSTHSSIDRNVMIVSEKSNTTVEDTTKRSNVLALPELRLPYEMFRIDVQPKSVPTTGKIVVTVLRRY